MSAKNKRVVILSDIHAGHVAGLTHPSWWGCSGTLAQKTEKLRQACWEWYLKECKKLGKVDLCIVNGDAIDGRGEASGSRELISVDRMDQCDIAVAAIQQVRAKKYAMSFGTPYHTGKAEDFERRIAEKLDAHIADQLWLDVNGVMFDCKHKVGGSGIPHGRHTAVAKERMWNMLWNDMDEGQPRADIFIRSHVHYHGYCGGAGWLGMTTPALQAAATVYGGRQCSGTVDFGFIVFDINTKGQYTWQAKLAKLKAQQAQALKY